VQSCEQQLVPPAQAEPFAAQVAPASAPDEGGWHAYPLSSPPVWRQDVPAQQLFELGTQVAPIGVQVELGGVQKKPPTPGKHDAPLQHWPLSWHAALATMQHGLWPV
jgi:hypothetical protein